VQKLFVKMAKAGKPIPGRLSNADYYIELGRKEREEKRKKK
jgi:hypothetical protein